MTVIVEKINKAYPVIEKLLCEKLKSRKDRDTMQYCLKMSSHLWAGLTDGEIACVWGLIPPSLMSERAYLWLYTTELAEKHTFLLVRWSQIEVKKMLQEYPVIVGHAAANNPQAIRWLKWLGATFGEPEGLKVPFMIRAK